MGEVMTPAICRFGKIASLILLVLLGLVFGINLMIKERKMTSANRIEAIFKDARTVCVGRFLIDVPKSAIIVFGAARVPVETWRNVGEGERLEEYVKEAVAKSEEDRWLARDALVSNTSLLGKVLDGVGPSHKIVFGVGRGDGSSYNVQSFVRVGHDLYIQEYAAFGEDNKYLKAVEEAREIAGRLRPRGEDEIPQDSGFCIDGAFISDPRMYMVEAASFGIRLKEFEGVHVSIQMTKKARLVTSDAIEPRLKSAEKSIEALGYGSWYKRIDFLRRGPRKIGDWDGFEVAAHRPAIESEEESHEFAFLSHGEPKNPMLPVLDVKLHTGIKDNEIGAMVPSITDAEALHLWDRILSSIRPRSVQNSNAN
jgi:hypothetical protein